MATYTATVVSSVILSAGAGVDTGYLLPLQEGWMITGETDGTYTATAKVISGTNLVADVGDGQQRNFLYDNIYIIPQDQYAGYVSAPSFSVGAVTRDITRTVTIWNAHDHTNTLTAVAYTQAGVTISDGTSVPDTLPALQDSTYTLSIDKDGPFALDCDITFTFSVDDSPGLSITGFRATLYNYWAQAPLKETLQPLTWTFVSDDGSEQRMRLRDVPRRNLGVNSLLTPAQWREAQNVIRTRRGNTWAVPLYHEATFQTATYTAGTTTLTLDTTASEYYAGGLVMVWKSSTEHALVQASTVAAGSITLADALESTFTGELRIAPCMTAKMTNFSSQVDPVGNRKVSASFSVYDGDDLSGQTESVTLGGYDVLTRYAEGTSVGDNLEIDIWEVDADIGGAKWGTVWTRAKQKRQYKITLTDSDDIWWFRRFVHSHTNRDPFWMTTNEADFQLSASITAAANSVRVYDNSLFDNSTGRTGICIQYADGTADYRAITSFAEYDADETTINLGSATSNGTTQTAADTKASALWLVVLDGDVSFTHYGNYSVATFTVSEVFA